jgi:hypothetical protein
LEAEVEELEAKNYTTPDDFNQIDIDDGGYSILADLSSD